MNGFSERSRKGWETRKRMESSRGFGPKGRKRGTEAHRVKSVSEILARVRGGNNHGSGDPTPPTPLDWRTHDAGTCEEREFAVGARTPETTG